MKITRLGATAIAVGTGALVLAGCTTPPPADDDAGLDAGTSISVAWNQAFYSANGNTSFGNATANNNINYLTYGTFGRYDNTPEFQWDESFGTVEQVSEDPLVVKYTLSDDAQWSDGTPLDASDLLLNWASQSNAFNDADFDPTEFTDQDTGAFTDDFPTDQVYFDGGGTGLDLVTQTPEVGDDNKSITLTYDEPFVDWQLVFGTSGQILPAHIVGEKALDIDDPAEAQAAVTDAIVNADAAALAPISAAWNSIFNFTETPSDPDLLVGSGPYLISELVADQYITLVANENYTGQYEPQTEEITIRFIGDPLAAVTALENGEVEIISPQATTDVADALGALDGVNVLTGLEGTYEHVDLQFSDSLNGTFDDPLVREAFLKTIPRQEILDTLIKPIIGDDAILRDSQNVVPGATGYDEIVAGNGSADYATVDIAGAQALLEEAGVTDPEVCILYASNNPRRVNEFALIQASAAEAGFTVTDCGSEDWGGLLGTAGAYDASLFGWQSTGTGVTESRANYVPDGLNNLNFYSNDEVTALYDELNGTFDEAEQIRIQTEIEAQLWGDAYGVTLYQFPSVTGVAEGIEGVDPSVIAPTIFWNAWDWTRS